MKDKHNDPEKWTLYNRGINDFPEELLEKGKKIISEEHE